MIIATRRNLWIAIAVVALGQAAVLGWMIWDRTSLLANGREVVLEVIPVDPRSLFRGDYVILGYDISRFDSAGRRRSRRSETRRIISRSRKSRWRQLAGRRRRQRAARRRASRRGRDQGPRRLRQPARRPIGRKTRPIVGLHYGIESFFVPEGTGRELEKMVGDKKISAVIAVDDDGNAAIKGLMSEGQRIYEEPLL